MTNKQEQLEKIKADILKQKICPELAAGASQLVFGDGSPDSDLVFIGEAPGKNEDIQGLPFVGAAGKFLNEMLALIGLSREDVYITNIVKYRPPENRDPLPDEKAAFLPFLRAQLEVIKPKAVVTLGRHSMECFLPGLQISNVHGQPKRIKLRLSSSQIVDSSSDRKPSSPNYDLQTTNYEEVVILPLFHPAAALYNGGMRQTLIDDFSRIPAILKKIES